MQKRTIMVGTGFVLTTFVYVLWFVIYGRIFGMGDVDNYIVMCSAGPRLADARHIIMTYLSCAPVALCVILPAVFWFGIVDSIWRIYGGDRAFIFTFATAAIPLFFILSIWSQWFSVMFLILADRARDATWKIIYLALACFYLPVFLYGLSILSWSGFLLVLMAGFRWEGFQMLFYQDPTGWVPIMSLIFYVCPVVWVPMFFGKNKYDAKWRAVFALFSFQYLGRLLIYLFPHMEIRLTNAKRLLIILWFLAVVAFFLQSMKNEALCIGGLCRMVPYG